MTDSTETINTNFNNISTYDDIIKLSNLFQNLELKNDYNQTSIFIQPKLDKKYRKKDPLVINQISSIVSNHALIKLDLSNFNKKINCIFNTINKNISMDIIDITNNKPILSEYLKELNKLGYFFHSLFAFLLDNEFIIQGGFIRDLLNKSLKKDDFDIDIFSSNLDKIFELLFTFYKYENKYYNKFLMFCILSLDHIFKSDYSIKTINYNIYRIFNSDYDTLS